MLLNIFRVGVRRMGPDSFQWCPPTGQGAMGTNWSRGSSIWTWGRTSSLWGWRSLGSGCPGRLWSLLLWRYSRLVWTRSCAACCRWPCFGRGFGQDDPQRSLPTPNILCFCDPSALHYSAGLLGAVLFRGTDHMGRWWVVVAWLSGCKCWPGLAHWEGTFCPWDRPAW